MFFILLLQFNVVSNGNWREIAHLQLHLNLFCILNSTKCCTLNLFDAKEKLFHRKPVFSAPKSNDLNNHFERHLGVSVGIRMKSRANLQQPLTIDQCVHSTEVECTENMRVDLRALCDYRALCVCCVLVFVLYECA